MIYIYLKNLTSSNVSKFLFTQILSYCPFYGLKNKISIYVESILAKYLVKFRWWNWRSQVLAHVGMKLRRSFLRSISSWSSVGRAHVKPDTSQLSALACIDRNWYRACVFIWQLEYEQRKRERRPKRGKEKKRTHLEKDFLSIHPD